VSDDPIPSHLTTEPVLSEEDRARAFAGTLPGARATVSPRVVKWTALIIGVLVVGSTMLESAMSGGTGATTTTPVTTVSAPSVQPPLGSTLHSILGLKAIGPTPAPPIDLAAPNGQPWSLSAQRGHVVLVTFFDANCDDICPVLGAEIRQALSDLGTRAASVRVVIINTNPKLTTATSAVPALDKTGLAHRSNVTFVTGSLNQLNSIWTNYGVTINVGARANEIAHNNVLYFVDPRGRLRQLALPFANEGANRAYSLSPTEIARFAQGVANVAGSLIR
jgi:protein SCO1